MNYQVKKEFTAKIDNKQIIFRPGDTVDITEDKAARLITAGVLSPRLSTTELDRMEAEYFRYLKRFFEIDDDPAATIEEARDLLARLEVLFQELHRQGRKVPVWLPTGSKAA